MIQDLNKVVSQRLGRGFQISQEQIIKGEREVIQEEDKIEDPVVEYKTSSMKFHDFKRDPATLLVVDSNSHSHKVKGLGSDGMDQDTVQGRDSQNLPIKKMKTQLMNTEEGADDYDIDSSDEDKKKPKIRPRANTIQI